MNLRNLLLFGLVAALIVGEGVTGSWNTALGILNDHLAANDFALGGRPTIADISMCGYLFWPDEIGISWTGEFRHIGRWLDRIAALPGCVHPYKLMPGHPLPGRS